MEQRLFRSYQRRGGPQRQYEGKEKKHISSPKTPPCPSEFPDSLLLLWAFYQKSARCLLRHISQFSLGKRLDRGVRECYRMPQNYSASPCCLSLSPDPATYSMQNGKCDAKCKKTPPVLHEHRPFFCRKSRQLLHFIVLALFLLLSALPVLSRLLIPKTACHKDCCHDECWSLCNPRF